MAGALTLPNLISLGRLLLVPVLWFWMADGRAAAAGWLLGGIGATDWVDGYLARRLGQVSEVGKFLDPLADRVAVVVAVVGGLVFAILPRWIAIAIIVREALVAVGGLYLAVKARTTLEVHKLGKRATALVYIAVPCYFVGVGSSFEPLKVLAWACLIPGIVLYYLVAILYFKEARRKLTERTV